MARNLSTPDWQTRIRTGRSLVPDLPLDKIAAQRGTRHTNSGYRFADSRHATVTERASGWRIISTCRSCPQAAHTPGLRFRVRRAYAPRRHGTRARRRRDGRRSGNLTPSKKEIQLRELVL